MKLFLTFACLSTFAPAAQGLVKTTAKSFLHAVAKATSVGKCTDSCMNADNCPLGDFNGGNYHGVGVCMDCCCGNGAGTFQGGEWDTCCQVQDRGVCPVVNEAALIKEHLAGGGPKKGGGEDGAWDGNAIFDAFLPMGCLIVDIPKENRIYYADETPKEDQKKMTPSLCFNFCRDKLGRLPPPALFFGLEHGRDCFCAAGMKKGVAGSGNCDAVCEGDGSSMCGGMTGKVSAFALHRCGDTKEEAEKLVKEAKDLVKVIKQEESFWEGTQADVDAAIHGAGDAGARYTFQGEARAFAALLSALKKDATTLDAAADKTAAAVKTQDLTSLLGQQEVEAGVAEINEAHATAAKSKKALEKYVEDNFKPKGV